MKITLPDVRSLAAGAGRGIDYTLVTVRYIVGCLALLLTLVTGAYADDTEIFFSQNGDATNVLFILDTSGSMSSRDGGTSTRLERMQDALNQLLDKISGINVGVMSYTSRRTMGLKQPVRAVSYTHLTLPTILLV